MVFFGIIGCKLDKNVSNSVWARIIEAAHAVLAFASAHFVVVSRVHPDFKPFFVSKKEWNTA
jgi:hypothetical protein